MSEHSVYGIRLPAAMADDEPAVRAALTAHAHMHGWIVDADAPITSRIVTGPVWEPELDRVALLVAEADAHRA